MADSNLVISAFGLSATGKGQNLDNMYLNGRYINVPTETSSKISKQEHGSFQVYGVSDSEIGIGEDRSIGAETGAIVMDMLQYTQNTLANQRIEKEPIWESIIEANRATKDIRTQIGQDTLGTSFAALFLHGNRGLAVHLGDSRIYVIRGGRTLQITDDHLESSDMFRLGILSQAQAEVHKSSSRLTAYVGMDNVYDCRDEAFSKYFIFYPGDIFILCTDGVTDAILNDKLEKITRLLKDATPDQIATTLMDAAGEHSVDDRTIVVLRIEAVGGEVAAKPVAPAVPAPTESAFNVQQPMNPAVPTQHSLNAPLPQAAPVAAPAVPQAAPVAPQMAPQAAPQMMQQPQYQQPQQVPMGQPQNMPVDPMMMGAPMGAPVGDEEPQEGKGGFDIKAIIDDLMASPKKLAMVIGIAAGILILLIVLIVAIAKGGKNNKKDPNQIAAEQGSSVTTMDSSDITDSALNPDVTPVYQESSKEESSEESSKPTTEYYFVEEGDTLYQIVVDYYDSADLDLMEALAKYNDFDMDEGIWVGQRLELPPIEKLGFGAEPEEEESSEESVEETEENSEETEE